VSKDLPLGAREAWELLNSWSADEVDVYERPSAHPNHDCAGETTAWIEVQKQVLRSHGVEVAWHPPSGPYRVVAVRERELERAGEGEGRTCE